MERILRCYGSAVGKHDAAASELIVAAIEPGETVIAACLDVTHRGEGDMGQAFVATDRNVRYFRFGRRWRVGRKDGRGFPLGITPLLITSNLVIPYQSVRAVATEQVGAFVGKLLVETRYDGGTIRWQLSREDGELIADAINRGVATVGSRGAAGIASEVERLAALATEGVISPDEYERGKELYLGKSPDQRDEALDLLRKLHGLFKSGVLSESEFNMKKWDVLSRKL